MFLVKCQCGSIFTLPDTVSQNRSFKIACPSCNKTGPMLSTLYLDELQKLELAGLTLQLIPNSAKITVTFDA